MKKLLLLFVFLILCQTAFSKGASGKYFIEGKAFDSNNKVLSHSIITVDFNNTLAEVRTDGSGNYKLEISWTTSCPSGATELEIEKDNDRMNPKWIYLSCNGIEIKVENQWRKYGMVSYENESGNIRNLDLIFKKE